MIRMSLLSVLLAWSFMAHAGQAKSAPKPQPPLMQDFFLYSCVHAYTKAHALPQFDSSVGQVVEHSKATPEELDAVYQAAKTFALMLPKPDLSDEEHGGVAVMAACLRESRGQRRAE